ncbi:Zinc finger BED domain-containing protein 4 [Argiope bruennichi]|uniref:Zinc finger BED domain-containing protein 4 n=1 Tax=Argiope bruennichi TaxID=94029 RepID=A0A8T0FZS4_ARGBR|nr:Zinc finger BED domain-containing protein 4 [Argiope bruennichi]
MKSSRKSSPMWNHFEERAQDTKAKCKYCGSLVSYTGGSTGNLLRHMKTQHITIPLDVKRQDVNISINNISVGEENTTVNEEHPIPSTSRDSPSTSSANMKGICRLNADIKNYFTKPLSMAKNKQLDEQLLKMIVKEYQPFSLVEDGEFQKFVHMLCPNYKLPTRKTLSNTILQTCYVESIQKVKENVKLAPAICLTMNSWTSINNESFLAVTAHFIDSATQLKTFLLDCSKLDASHTSSELCKQIKRIASEWEITNKIVAIVTDNAFNIVGGVHESGFRSLTYFAHSLNLVVKKGLDEIKFVLEKVKRIVEHFKRSSSALSTLHKMQNQMKLPNLKLKQDVATRWNSTFDMLTRIQKNKEPLLSTVGLLQLPEEFKLNPKEWEIIDHSINALVVFNAITVEISAETTVSASKITVLAKFLSKHVNSLLEQTAVPKEVKNMCQIFKQEIHKRFFALESNELISQSVFLDPKFKRKGFTPEKFNAVKTAVEKKKIAGFNLPQQNDKEVVDKKR